MRFILEPGTLVHTKEHRRHSTQTCFLPQPWVKENIRPLDKVELTDSVKRIEEGIATESVRLGILFVIYTAARSNEVREATRVGMNLDAATWFTHTEREYETNKTTAQTPVQVRDLGS